MLENTPNLILLAIAGLNAVTAILAYRTHALTQQVEKATNSMKDALVKSSSEAAHAAGFKEATDAAGVKAAAVAEGRLEQKSTEG